MIANNQKEIELLQMAGSILADALREAARIVNPGVTTAALDIAAEKFVRARGAAPAFLNYKPVDAPYAYPAALCVSINDEVVHGIPSEKRKLFTGDIVSLDLGLSYEGFFVDSAITVCVGACDANATKLLTATQEALAAAIAAARVGGRTGDIGAAVADVAKKYKLSVIKDLGGHAVGRAVHEKPFIANEGISGVGEELVEGMVLALEPMLAEGKGAIVLAEDEWTYKTRDHSRSAHFEHTVLLTRNGPKILTRT